MHLSQPVTPFVTAKSTSDAWRPNNEEITNNTKIKK